MTYLCIIAFVFILVYIYNLIRVITKLAKIVSMREKTEKILMKLDKLSETEIVSELIVLNPETRLLIGNQYWGGFEMSHSTKDDENLQIAFNAFQKLKDVENETRNELHHAFYPVNSIDNTFRLPALILDKFGFNLKRTVSNFVSFLGWLLPILIPLISDWIK